MSHENCTDKLTSISPRSNLSEVSTLLRLLALRVYDARVGGVRLHDATDFKAWLLRCADTASRSESLDDFFSKID